MSTVEGESWKQKSKAIIANVNYAKMKNRVNEVSYLFLFLNLDPIDPSFSICTILNNKKIVTFELPKNKQTFAWLKKSLHCI